ncbi:hypothetical protein Ddc_16356 [Ditylenchus destructor]|nr:hypothetical protein Ddc_16356 [Ditylenchus destructor]
MSFSIESLTNGSSACRLTGCHVGWECDTVANRCRNLRTGTPSCANDCPQGSYCGSKSNKCIRITTKALATTTADPRACNPNCEPPLVCDAVANTCRDPNTGYPSCQSTPCPSGSYCGFTSNMCECDPRTKEHCPVEGCSVGYHCNTCNVCESDTTLTRTPEISTTTQEPMTCDPTCEPQFICDAVRNVCVNPSTRQPSCSEKPCPLGAHCNMAISMCSCKPGKQRACPDEGCPDGYHCNACNVCEADTSLTRTPEISTTIPARRQGPMSKHELPNSPTATVAPSTTNGALTLNDSSPITPNAGARICATNLLLITLSLIICVKIFS